MKLKNYDRYKLGYIEGVVSILANVVLFGFKLWVGMITGSVAMLADAWHTLSDSITSVILLVGVKYSSKGPDRQHPYGHGRAESIAAVIIATLLFVVGVTFLKESIFKLSPEKSPVISRIAVYIFAGSALIKEALAQFSIWAGKKTDSDVLKADGWHHRSDAITTLIIIIGFFFYSSYPWVDGVLGLMVSGFIIYSAYEIIRDASKSILGTTMPSDLKDKICKIIEAKYTQVEDAHHFHIHKYGQHRELTMHICLSETITLKAAHDIIDRLENEIYKKFKIDTTIHPDCRIHKI